MRILCSFPGRYGDIGWALPTCRALAERHDTPVDLVIAGEFAGILPLLRLQPYLGTVEALPDWHMTPPEEWKAPGLQGRLEGSGLIVELGYRGWPGKPLPFAMAETAGVEIDLTRPWISTPPSHDGTVIAVGFTEAWFELKVGLLNLLGRQLPPHLILTPHGSRWQAERPLGPLGPYQVCPCDWLQAATRIRNSRLFFGDCSALHVLAVGLGKKVLLCEPMEGRWNPIFYPLGMDGPQVTVIKGNTGLPSFDARHCADAIREALR